VQLLHDANIDFIDTRQSEKLQTISLPEKR
jgi:hypothetical protein